MKRVDKTIRPRLPREVVEKLREGRGCGRHTDRKKDFRRQPKHKYKNTEGSG